MKTVSVREVRRAVLSLAMQIGGGLSSLLALEWSEFMAWYDTAVELLREERG